jgi:hypothetical protein
VLAAAARPCRIDARRKQDTSEGKREQRDDCEGDPELGESSRRVARPERPKTTTNVWAIPAVSPGRSAPPQPGRNRPQ